MAGDPEILILVVPGGTADVEDFLVGQLRELRVDTDNDSLRLHDGVKEGGYEFLNRDQSDARYQPRSAELDGFNFGAQLKGILVRVGPAQYKIRRVTSDSNDLTITNPRGTAGDFDLRISDEVTTAHTWDAVQTFIERIVAQDGLTGDTYGTHNGDVIGGDLAGIFTGVGHGTFDGSFTGNVNVSGHNFVTADGQILETQIDPEAWIRRGVPQGAILMWSGTADTIPESWALCDGTLGTPDLRDRFIIGAGVGGSYKAPGTSGGSATTSLTGVLATGGAHTHPLAIDGHALTTAEIPSHNHHNGVTNGNSSFFNHGSVAADPDGSKHPQEASPSGSGVEGLTGSTGGGAEHTHTGNTTSSGIHSHDLTLDDASIIPPYYALCYIMKTV